MGGNAFAAVLQPTAFPRLPPAVYQALKMRIQPLLADLYVHVGVPREAPQKIDHGDLDLVVCLPRRHTILAQSPHEFRTDCDAKVPFHESLEIVAAAIGAKHINSMVGNCTSNYAVPIAEREWAASGQSEAEAETKARKDANEEGIFYQVDISICESKEDWDRQIFHDGYGDLNMIMGLIAKNAGLHYSSKGLKIPDPPNPPLILSDSFDEIVDFFGWSMEDWKTGFETNLACYKWAVNTKFFDPSRFRTSGPGIKRRKQDRTMYAGFIEWAGTISQEIPTAECSGQIPNAREAALDFFNKRSEFDERRSVERRKEALKTFSGTNVRDWTNLGNYWLGVKRIMDEVREELGGDDNVAKYLDDKGEEELKRIVLEVQARLEVWPRENVLTGEEKAQNKL